jgi:hypothetical protein
MPKRDKLFPAKSEIRHQRFVILGKVEKMKSKSIG